MRSSAVTWRISSYSASGNTCVEVGWQTSSYSASGGSCVEVARPEEEVLIRDTKDRTGGTLALSTGTWRALLTDLG